jgi:hypothetical protein
MKAIGEGRNSAVGLSPWDGGVGLLPRGLGGRCGLGYQLVFLPFWVIFLGDLFCLLYQRTHHAVMMFLFFLCLFTFCCYTGFSSSSLALYSSLSLGSLISSSIRRSTTCTLVIQYISPK